MMRFGFSEEDFVNFPNYMISHAADEEFHHDGNGGINEAFFCVTLRDTSRKNSLKIGDNCQGNFAYMILFGNENEITQNIETEIVVGNNSKLKMDVFCAGTPQSVVNHSIKLSIGRDSEVTLSNSIIAGKSNNYKLNVDFLGENSVVNLPTILMPGDDEKIELQSVINHNVPRCSSKQTVRSVVSGNGVSDFYGLIKVAKDAQKTQAEQVNNNILLSENARALSKPQLEIYADDVKCSHGSTTGMLDKEALFYMRSRGISLETAQNLMIKAFINEVAGQIESEDFRRYLDYQTSVKLASFGE
ncbi:MAG: SufD family Fe-S cluster assembly protein [Bacteroidales bacterium]|nr:SufD family Fe-S cluster assembly protein [Bacteroidales bacterium]MBR4678372.1 SufD family Fe-S cluster assembly protein [Bacteroidales bacterium]MEE3448571.1 SufD family Fe-S cluster assembly protein [Bacteroidales bacterium]